MRNPAQRGRYNRIMLRGWCFPSTAWLVIFNVGLSFVFVYGLAASDHHMAERIPLHSHLLTTGSPVPQHAHTFGRVHPHAHNGTQLEAAGGATAVTTAPPPTVLEAWSIQVAPPSESIPLSPRPTGFRNIETRILRDQVSLAPLIHPPAHSSANPF